MPKAETNCFLSVLHKYSGVGFNTSNADETTCFFTRDKVEKKLHFFKEAEQRMYAGELKFNLDFARSVHGNWVWFDMVYPMLKRTASGWRRRLGGVDTTAKEPH